MRLRSLTWASDKGMLLEAAHDLGVDLTAWSISELDEGNVEECIRSLQEAEIVILHPSLQDLLFERVVKGIDKKIPVVSFGFDPSLWSFSNLPAKIVSTANAYVVYGGAVNIANMMKYLGREVLGRDYDYDPPQKSLWEGLYHPDSKKPFATVEEYLQWYGKRREKCVGILFFRTYWANGDLDVVDALIRELEKDYDVLPAFCFAMGDKDLEAKSSGEVAEEFFAGT